MTALVLPAVLFVTLASVAMGGVYVVLSFALIAALALLVDAFQPDADHGAVAPPSWSREAPLVLTPLLIALTTAIVMLRVSDAWRPPGTSAYGIVDTLAATASLGVIFGTAAAVVGHELIHRIDRPLWVLLGQFMQAFPLDTADTVEHVYGHHVTVATSDDPSTARRGEGFWAYLPRAMAGAFASAWRIERNRLRQLCLGAWSPRNLILQGLAVQFALLAICFSLGGWRGLAVVLAAGIFARILIEISKYASHYGLVRVPGAPVEPRHSWNGAGVIVSDVMLRSSCHSDHHVHPERPYWDLSPHDDAPAQPYSAGVTTLIAFVPPLWRRMMAPRLDAWDAQLASEGERALAAQQG